MTDTPTPAPPRLHIDALAKRYGERRAIDGLSLTLQPGCFAALLGPNGAGKSTLFQVLTGLFAADAGDLRVDGHSLRNNAVKALAHFDGSPAHVGDGTAGDGGHRADAAGDEGEAVGVSFVGALEHEQIGRAHV